MSDYQTGTFRLRETSRRRVRGAQMIRLEIRDKYAGARFRPERSAFQFFVRRIERHLRSHPQIDFAHRLNIPRRIIYFPKAVRKWATYMPGGFATYPVHNPAVKRLHSGEKIDYITRNLFRHSSDGIGLRSRAHAMSWYVATRIETTRKSRLRWLSIAAGTGQPTFDAAENLTRRPLLFLSDLSDEAMSFAEKLGRRRGFEADLTIAKCDVAEPGAFSSLLRRVKPDIVDMMGLVEYLDDAMIVQLVQDFVDGQGEATLIFTNMRPEHPQLATHQRGLGWPGVKVRTIDAVLDLLERAGVKLEIVEVLLPDDHVYAIYCIKRP